ncbi:MAG: 50S ribosomal protein L29 [candidate division Zixibacteria bacterium]|nr:50S ribosomal protein L29 [candidate division Zixibacteria bacterium]
MKTIALRDMTKDELIQKKNEITEELFNLNMRRTLKELDNPLKLRTLRRDIAKIETLLSEDKLGIRRIVKASISILDKGADKNTQIKTDKKE